MSRIVYVNGDYVPEEEDRLREAYDLLRSVVGARAAGGDFVRDSEVKRHMLERDPDFDEATEGEEVSRKEKLKTRWAQLEALVGTEKRLKLIAEDIVDSLSPVFLALEPRQFLRRPVAGNDLVVLVENDRAIGHCICRLANLSQKLAIAVFASRRFLVFVAKPGEKLLPAPFPVAKIIEITRA